MRGIDRSQYRFVTNVDGTWTICEDDLDYELALPSYPACVRLLAGIRWIEETYSPPRE